MDRKDLILGAHVFFIPAGTIVDGSPVSQLVKPDTTPESNWTAYKCGSIENFEPQSSSTKLERYSPNRGKFALRKVISTQRKLVFNIGIQEWTRGMLTLLLGSEPADTDGTFVPNSRGDDQEGWLKIQAYDQNDDLIFVVDGWISASIASYQFQNGISPYTLVAAMLTSPLNSGEIQNLAA